MVGCYAGAMAEAAAKLCSAAESARAAAAKASAIVVLNIDRHSGPASASILYITLSSPFQNAVRGHRSKPLYGASLSHCVP